MSGIVLAPQRAKRVEADDLRVVQVVQAFHVEDHDLADSGHPRAHFQHLVELLLVLDEGEHRTRVRKQVFDLRGRIRRVDTVHHAGRAQRAEIGAHPFLVGVGEN